MTHPLSSDDALAAAERRGNTYKLLAECYHPPNDELPDLLADADRQGALEVDVGALATEIPEDVETLRVDYAKLFVGPFELLAPPYGSVYLEEGEQVMGNSTLDVMAHYRQAGLDVDLDEPADHVAAELEFVYYLVTTEVEALADGDLERGADSLRKQEQFLTAHLGDWIGEFAADVEENAETEFYRVLARETASFVEDDRQRLSDRLDRLEDATAGHPSASDADDA